MDAANNKGRHFSDDDVDKFYLAGFSPFEEFRNTKSFSWVTDCYRSAFPRKPALKPLEWEQWSRNDDLKATYDALSQEEKNKYGYEHDLLLFLEELVARCDQRIKVVREEINIQNENIMKSMHKSDQDALDVVSKELEELRKKVAEVEKKAEREETGSFDELQGLMKQEDVKVKDKAEIVRRVDVWRNESQRAVCEISGNVTLAPGVKAQALHSHEEGKQFQGWKAARNLLKELRLKDVKGLKPADP